MCRLRVLGMHGHNKYLIGISCDDISKTIDSKIKDAVTIFSKCRYDINM